MGLTVQLSDHFRALFANLPDGDKVKIAEFIKHCQDRGFDGLCGKLVHTKNVPGTDPDYNEKYRFAVDHYLWHYHIGIPVYTLPRNAWSNYLTSDWVLHLQRFPGDKVIRIVDLDFHDPMHMPKPDHLVFSQP